MNTYAKQDRYLAGLRYRLFVLMSSSVGVHVDLTGLSQDVGEDALGSPNTAPHNAIVPLAQMKGFAA